MRFFIFQSDAGAGLRAFAGDAAGRDRRSSLGLGLVRPGLLLPLTFPAIRSKRRSALMAHQTAT
jgi:hypothetical protein